MFLCALVLEWENCSFSTLEESNKATLVPITIDGLLQECLLSYGKVLKILEA